MTSGRSNAALTVSLAVALVALAAAGPAAAQERSDRVTAELTVSGSVFDNFFRVAEDSLERSLYAGRLEGRIGVRPDAGSPLRLFVMGSWVEYEDLGGSPEAGVGVELDARPHTLRIRGSYQDDRPAFDLGEVVRTADITHLVGNYAYRLAEDWEVGVEGQFAAFRFDSVPQNDSELSEVGAASGGGDSATSSPRRSGRASGNGRRTTRTSSTTATGSSPG